jgi:uncharacterized Zn finger protein (UPF0148 family)
MADDAVAALARGQKWSMAYAREFASDLEAVGVHLIYRPMTEELCPRCGYHYATESGVCVRCETEEEESRRQEELEDERRRLTRDRKRKVDAVKQALKRMREPLLANPRDKRAKELVAAVEQFLELTEAAWDEEEGGED